MILCWDASALEVPGPEGARYIGVLRASSRYLMIHKSIRDSLCPFIKLGCHYGTVEWVVLLGLRGFPLEEPRSATSTFYPNEGAYLRYCTLAILPVP